MQFIQYKGKTIAIANERLFISTPEAAAELLINCQYSGTNKILVRESNLDPAFFDLRSGVAGDILQKFSNYDGYLAIVGDFSKFNSKSLAAFIRESNRQGRITFTSSADDAKTALASTP